MVVRNGLVTSGLVTTGFRDTGLGKTRDGPATAVMAGARRPKIMAVDAGRGHGRNLSPGIPRAASRCVGTGRRERAACKAGIAIPLLRLSIQPAKLDFGLCARAYSPAICSRGRLPRSIPRNL